MFGGSVGRGAGGGGVGVSRCPAPCSGAGPGLLPHAAGPLKCCSAAVLQCLTAAAAKLLKTCGDINLIIL